MLADLDLHSIADDRARARVRQLRNLLEDVTADLRAAHAESQRLRDELNRCKGEQGQPTLKATTPPPPLQDHSSEKERRTPKAWAKGRNTDRIPLDREQMGPGEPDRVPPDAVGQGYEDVVGQDVIFRTDPILFHTETWDSPSQRTTLLASRPQGDRGPCGPGLTSLALGLYCGAQMSEPKVAEWVRSGGGQRSDGEVSHRLSKDQAAFHAEQDALDQAGLARSPWQHRDDTSTRVKGPNGDGHIVCHPLYPASVTTAAKDRLPSIDVLTHHRPRRFLVHEEALGAVAACGLSAVRRRQLAQGPGAVIREEATLQALRDVHRPGWGLQQRTGLLDATAVAASHADRECPVVRLVVCDDAPPLTLVTAELALCGVHEGRHSTKLGPYVPYHRTLGEDCVPCFWTSYDQLLASREQPTPEEAVRLDGALEAVFSTVTGYQARDERLAKTHAKQGGLLMGLWHPEIPLHHHPAALGARARVRKRDVSFGPRPREGAKAWDTCMTWVETATKLGGSFSHSIHDRVSNAYQRPSLTDLIKERAGVLNLGASWNTS